MRLLNVHTLSFKDFHENHLPAYVIASHRWFDQDEEATYKGVLEKREGEERGRRRRGFGKVERFCGFVRDSGSGIEWLWIDTCCIDKESSAELQESINSMFRWYRRARCCLAWLGDVGGSVKEEAGVGDEERKSDGGGRVEEGDGEDKVMKEFRNSVWFTRAWTLQELLAPTTVLFVDANWSRIGYKGCVRKGMKSFVGTDIDLTPTIHEITGIRESVLYDYSRSRSLSFEEKQEWVVRRETTREEDKAYCLLGIFNVSMPLVYGERRKAQKRLWKEIQEKERERGVRRERKRENRRKIKEERGKGKRRKERGGWELQPIQEEQLPVMVHEVQSPLPENPKIDLLPPGSEYEDESTQEHRHVAIISSIRNRWQAEGSRDVAIYWIAVSLEELGYPDPGDLIHCALYYVARRAQHLQTAYFEMMRMRWRHERAVGFMTETLEEKGHALDIARAVVLEYLMFNPAAIDPWSLPYVPSKQALAVGDIEESGEPPEKRETEDLVINVEKIAGPAGDVAVKDESESSIEAKLSGPGVSRQSEIMKVPEPVALQITFDAFVQMHLFN